MMATMTIMPAMIYFCMEIAITATAKAVSPIMTQSIIIRRANLFGSLIIICLFCNKVLNYFQCFRFGFLQLVVYDYHIKLVGKTQFKLCFGNAAFDYVRCICSPAYQSVVKFFYARGLDEKL